MAQFEVLTVTEARNNLPTLLKSVQEDGQVVFIGSHRRPQAVLSPVADDQLRPALTPRRRPSSPPVDSLTAALQAAWDAGVPLMANTIGYTMAYAFLDGGGRQLAAVPDTQPIFHYLWAAHRAGNSSPLEAMLRITWDTIVSTCAETNPPALEALADILAPELTADDSDRAREHILSVLSPW